MNLKTEKKRFGNIEIPLQRVHIELTNICNFNCTFCPKSEMKRPYGYMDVGLAKRIIDDLKSNNICDKITFHIMGEPTLHPHFFEILDHAQERNVKVGLTTNGAGLDGPIGKRLMRYDLYQVDVSLQTPDERSFALRKSGSLSFDEYVEGILNFFSAYKVKEKKSIFKFRFLNTRFRSKKMSQKTDSLNINSSARELRETFRRWAERIYDLLGVHGEKRERALRGIHRLASYKWNVVEIYPNVFFETYLLSTWEDKLENGRIRDAWAGYCYGMRDHFGILYNGDVVLCCIDFNGKTAIGNLHNSSLHEILSSPEVAEVIQGFKRFRAVHPYCKKCLGSKTLSGWMFKPIGQILSLKTLKPIFYNQTSLWK